MLGLASAWRNSGQYEKGSKLLSAALQKQPNDPALRVEYARNLLYQRQYAAAKDQYQQVLRWYPNNIDALIGLGKTYSWQGNQQLALEQYQKALVADPGNYDALVAQGFSLIWSGRQSEAVPMLERANSRHPEVAEVREALKRLNVVNIFTGDVSAGPPEWPIQGPSTSVSTRRGPEKGRGNTNSAWNPPSPEPANTTPEATGKSQPTISPPPASNSQPGRSILWVVGMGLTVLVVVFVVAAFFLFFLPTMRNKNQAKTAIDARLAQTKPEPSPVEQWARLEEFSRPERVVREPKSYRPLPPKAPTAPLPLSELLPPPPKPTEPEAGPVEPVATEKVMAVPAETSTSTPAQVLAEPDAGQPVPGVVEDHGAPAPRAPRRRRGTAASPDRPWWRDLSNPDLIKSVNQAEPEVAPAAAPELPPRPASPFLDVPDEVVLPSDAPNPLIPASEKPAPPEEPPPARPFTVVLSRALERAGDGQLEEPPEPIKPEEAKEAEYTPNGNGGGKRGSVSPHTLMHNVARELKDANVVIVGCGVMVTHYRAILKAAGADVRTFTFWDLAMSSMRKRRADVLLIDGDALDGFTPAQMYTSSQVERYMYGSILVGVSSEEDRSTLPEDVILAHSLSDDDLRNRFVESLQPW